MPSILNLYLIIKCFKIYLAMFVRLWSCERWKLGGHWSRHKYQWPSHHDNLLLQGQQVHLISMLQWFASAWLSLASSSHGYKRWRVSHSSCRWHHNFRIVIISLRLCYSWVLWGMSRIRRPGRGKAERPPAMPLGLANLVMLFKITSFRLQSVWAYFRRCSADFWLRFREQIPQHVSEVYPAECIVLSLGRMCTQ